MNCLICSDLDPDCEHIDDKLNCYEYDAGRGFCPYLTGDDMTTCIEDEKEACPQ